MERNFTLTEVGRRNAKHAIFRKTLTPFLIVQAIVVGCLIYLLRMSPIQISVTVGLALYVLWIFWRRTWSNPMLEFRNWGLHVGENSIYLTENPTDTEISRDQIRSLSESSIGLTIRTKDSIRRIWIPTGVEDYALIKGTLESWLRRGT